MAEQFSVEAILSAVDKSFSSTMNQALNNVYKLGQQTNQASGTIKGASSGIVGSVKGIAAGFGLVQVAGKAFDVVKNSVGGAIQRFDTLKQYPKVMSTLGYATDDVAKSTSIMKKGIDGLPTSLQEITGITQQLAPLTGSAEKAAKSAVALNNAFLAGGASAGDASRGLQQYTQMLSTGTVDLESWRTLMETMPGPLQQVAEAFGFAGKSAKNDLYQALKDGTITVDQLNDKFIELNSGTKGFATQAKNASAGIQTSFTNLKNSVVNNLTNMIDQIDQGFQKAGFGSIASILDGLKGSINSTFQIIGPIITETTTNILLALKKVIDFVNQNKDWLGPLALGIGTFVASLSGINKAIGIINGLKGPLQTIKSVGSALKGMAAGSQAASSALTFLAGESKIAAAAVSLLANPWMYIVAAIAAVVAALVLFFTKTKTGQAMWKSFTEWLSNAWNNLKEIASNVWTAITEFFTNAVEKIKAVWQPIGEFFSQLWQNIVTIAQGVWNSLVQGVAPIVEAFKNLWNTLSEFFSTLWQGIVTVAQTVWQGLVTIFTPIVEAIKLIWTGLTMFFTTLWQGIVTVAGPIWQLLVTVVQNVWNVIVAMWQNFVTVMSGIWQTVVTVASTVWQTLVTVIQTVWTIITTLVSTAINVVAGIIRAVTAAIQGDWSAAWEAIKEVASTIWNAITTIVSTVGNALKNIVKSIMDGIKNVFTTGWNTAKEVVSRGIKACKDAVANIAKTMINVGKDFVQGFINGVTSMISNAVNAVMDLGNKAVSAAKRFFKIGSPSKVMEDYGQWFTQGFAIGVTDELRAVKRAVTSMAKAAMVSVKPNLDMTDFQASLSNLNSAVNGNYSGSLTMKDSSLQMQNNALLRQIAEKSGNVYLDGDKWVGYTAGTYNSRFGQNVSLKDRWS